jgi:hypothetical protein
MCTHYGAPLADGLLVGDTIRCPWHHACFDLRTGEVVRAPALEDLKCWRVERHNDRAFVRKELPRPLPPKLTTAELPKSVVIIGGGAAGNAAVETLRREGYQGPVTMLRLILHCHKIGRICRRIISPGPRRPSGSLCGLRSSTQTIISM